MQGVLLLKVSDSHIGGSICEQKLRTVGLHNPPLHFCSGLPPSVPIEIVLKSAHLTLI